MSAIRTIWQKVLEILFPRICISCSQYLSAAEDNQLLCNSCFDLIEVQKTGRGAKIYSVGLYSSKPLRDLIYALKFRGNINAMEQIKKLIRKYFEKNSDSIFRECDLITFIPLHPKRQRERGFNQAELIANALGNLLSIEVRATLRRQLDTKAQSSIINYQIREDNVRGCFSLINDTNATSENTILVDDVYTSGATTKEAVGVLNSQSPNKIVVFVLAVVNG